MSVFSILLVVFMVSVNLEADVVPSPGSQHIGPTFESADLVCNCIITSTDIVSEEGIQAVGNPIVLRHEIASVEVRDIYKSRVPLGGQIFVEYDEEIPSTRASLPSLWKGEIALLFLKSVRPSTYILADQFLGATPFSKLSSAPGRAGMTKLESALVVALEGTNRDDMINALRLLQGFENLDPTTVSYLNKLSAAADPVIALSSIAVLLKGGTPASVELLKQFIDEYKGDSEPIALISIGSELGNVTDERAMQTIEKLSGSRYVSIRFGAMDALRRMRNPLSAPTLMQRLDDADSNVRYVAVITLAEIFGKYGDYAPNMYLLEKNPAMYIALWKNWWAQGAQNLEEGNH